jgi:hypothetical protein
MFSFQWLCHGLLSELQILDDLFCCLYLSAPGLPPALIAYNKKIRVMGIFRTPIHEKECSYYVHSQKLKYYVMLPLFSTYVNYDVTILFFQSLWREIALTMFHCFLQKNICVQNISHVDYHDIMNCKQVLSHIMFAYQTTCGRIDDWSILLLCKIWPTAGVLSKNLIFILGFYVGECPNVLKKDWLWPNLLCWGLPEVLEIFFSSSLWLLLKEKTMTPPLLN